jgi:hypothetical protein
LVGVAVNVTLVPEQIVLSASLEAMITLTGKFGFTVAVTAVLVADTQLLVKFLASA